MEKLKLPRWLFPVLVIVLIAGVVAANRYLQPAKPPLSIICPNLQNGCHAQLGGHEITFGVQGELKVLSPFEVWVKAPEAKEVQASFAMKDMDMGFNLYTLRPDPQGGFRARVTLPVCVSGRRDWFMILDVDGQKISLPFVTEL
ncbi:MAG: hypothetical protein P4L70_07650 [Parasulfuritortus sp.]|nr:hypothetical protein [Parasulfuritortus sp.]